MIVPEITLGDTASDFTLSGTTITGLSTSGQTRLSGCAIAHFKPSASLWSTVTAIAPSAFTSATPSDFLGKIVDIDLTGLTNLVTIGSGAFQDMGYDNPDFTHIDLSGLSKLTTIGDQAFYQVAYNSRTFNHIDLSNTFDPTSESNSIGQSAFSNVAAANLPITLESQTPYISLASSNVVTIEPNAFQYAMGSQIVTSSTFTCTLNLDNATKLTELKPQAFSDLTHFTELKFAGTTSLTIIGASSF